MARMVEVLPDEVIEQFKTIYDNYDHIFGRMTTAGARVVYANIQSNIPDAIKSSQMMRCLRLTKVYKTPTDDGINTKVAFYGYFTNHNGKRQPAPLVANVFEYGRSGRPFPKQPFLRRSFTPSTIKRAMLDVQKAASGGLLE